MKTRWLGNAYILALSLALFCWPATAPAQYSLTTVATPLSPDPINTGPGPTTGGGGLVVNGGSDYQWVAAQFTLTNPAAITQVQGWFSPQIGKPGTPCNSPCTVNVVIRANNNTYPTEPIPGGVIWSQTYTVTPPTTNSAWITFSNYEAVLAAGTYWVAFEPPVNSGFDVGFIGPGSGTGTGVTLLPQTSYAWYARGNGGYINFVNGPQNPPDTLSALTVSGYSLGTDSGSPLIVSGTFARTVTQGSIFNYNCGQNLSPVGNVGQTDALQWNICPGVYSASAYGTITANPNTYQGNILEAGAYSATGPNGSSGAGRGIVFSTYMNTTGSDIPNVQVNAILNGSITGASSNSPVSVAGAIYVFDTVYFTSFINSVVPNSSLLGYFLLGGNNVVVGEVNPDYANLGQSIFQSKYVDNSWDNNTQLVVCESDSCLQGYEVSTQGFDLPADAFFTVMFDVSASSQGPTSGQTTSIGDFLSTLEADPKYFFTDGTPTAQYPYGTPITGIVGPLTAAAVPATPVNISLSPSSQSTPVGSTTTVTATVTDANNNPVPDAIVRFSITSGPHAGFSMPVGTGDGTATLPNGSLIPVGSAIFNYTDTLGTGGMDSISATVGGISAPTSAQVTWTTPGPPYNITLSPPSTSISLGNSQIYTAAATDFFGNSIMGDVSGELTFTISPDGSCTFTTVETCTPTATGPHQVMATFTYPVSGVVVPAITPASLTVGSGSTPVTATAPSGTYVYGAAPALASLSPTFSQSVTLTTLASCTAMPMGSYTYPAAGTYTINCSGEAATNYTFTNNPGTITITPEPVTITASNTSMTYGGTAPTPTAAYAYGTVSGSASAPAGLTGTTCSSTANSTTPVGTDSGANTCSGATGSNYAITYAAGNVTVSAEPVTVTASNTTMTYGGTAPTPSALYTYGSVTRSATAPAGLTAPTCSTTANSTTPVGTDSGANTCSGASGSNYSISYASGSVTVSAEPVTITASNTSMTQGSTPPIPTPEYTYGSVTLSATAPTGLTGTTCSTTATNMTPVGTDTGANTCSGASGSNYSITYVAGNVVVNPAGQTPTFTITPEPAAETVTRGVVGGFLLKLQSVDGFDANVKLSCSGGPAGSYCVDLPMTVKVNGTDYAVSGILFPKNSNPGTYVITFTGVSGSLTVKATATFTVK